MTELSHENCTSAALLLLTLPAACQDGRTLSIWWPPLGAGFVFLGLADFFLPGAVQPGLRYLQAAALMAGLEAVKRLGPDFMGDGDIMYLGLLAAALPWQTFLHLVLGASLLGILVHGCLVYQRPQDTDVSIPFVSVLWLAFLTQEAYLCFAA